jgi:hypothetical protein
MLVGAQWPLVAWLTYPAERLVIYNIASRRYFDFRQSAAATGSERGDFGAIVGHRLYEGQYAGQLPAEVYAGA